MIKIGVYFDSYVADLQVLASEARVLEEYDLIDEAIAEAVYLENSICCLAKEDGHLKPRLHVWRKNYDLDEGWNIILDDYRSGKIKSIRDFISKKRKEKPRIKSIDK